MFKEATDKTMTLTEDEPAVIEAFADWVYARRYELPPEPGDVRPDDCYLLETMQLLVFSDRYDVRILKMELITKLMNRLTENHKAVSPGFRAISHIYENTSPNSGLRRLLVDWETWRVRGTCDYRNSRDKLLDVPEFAVDMLLRLSSYLLNEKNQHPFENQFATAYCEDLAQTPTSAPGMDVGNSSKEGSSKANDDDEES